MKKNKIQIKANSKDLKGIYSNMMRVSNKKEEFFLDFLLMADGGGIFGSRIIVSPDHLKRIIKTLQTSMDKYEKKFGDVEEAEKPKKKIGFITNN